MATTLDVASIRAIELASAEPFRHIGMAAIADDDPAPVELVTACIGAHQAWVWTDREARPAAFLLLESTPYLTHIEQISVHPSHARHGHGAALLDAVRIWAHERGRPELTLTTFRDVPWNAPYYHRLGYQVVDSVDQSAALATIRNGERARGLDRWPRVVMRLSVESAAAPRPAQPPQDLSTP